MYFVGCVGGFTNLGRGLFVVDGDAIEAFGEGKLREEGKDLCLLSVLEGFCFGQVLVKAGLIIHEDLNLIKPTLVSPPKY